MPSSSLDHISETQMPYHLNLLEKIGAHTVKLGVIGLGYVGLPLGCEFAEHGIHVVGFDVDLQKVTQLNRGESYIIDIKNDRLKGVVQSQKFEATHDFSRLAEMDVVSICVPTPLRKTKDPDMSYILKAVEFISKYVKQGQLIVLESTTYPGTTEEVICPALTHKGLKIGEDVFVVFSPERVDPGNARYTTKNTPKILGGMSAQCTEAGKKFYEIAIDTVVTVSSPRTAEMVKLFENIFRSVNIGLANELAMMCNKLGINVWEVIEAASTKPFGFMPFYPGPGLGGHCIPLDPFYLSWKLRAMNYEARFIGLAGEVNSHMPDYVIQKIFEALNNHKKSIRGASIFILGIAYKPDINDERESPSLPIVSKLVQLGAQVAYNDDYISSLDLGSHHQDVDLMLTSQPLAIETLQDADCVVILTNHKYYSPNFIQLHSQLVVDTRNLLKGYSGSHIFRI